VKSRLDFLTIAAISVVAYIIQNVLHEAVGHGGVCLLLGGEPTALSTAYFDMVDGSVSPLGRRLVAAGGAVVNILAGGVCWALLRTMRGAGDSFRFFLWLSMTINLLTGTGYLLFSGTTQVGDWVVVIAGFEPFWLWNTLMILIGLVTYLLCIWLSLSTMLPLIGVGDAVDVDRARRLSLHPYLLCCVASTMGAALNPLSPIFILTSAAANFGGTSGLAWMTQLYKTSWFKPSTRAGVNIGRSWPWIISAGLLLALHIAVLGPAVTF
jgi:hypothetical protein